MRNRKTKIATVVSTLAILAGCVTTCRYATQRIPETTVINYSVPLSPLTDPEGNLGRRGMSAFLIQLDPRHKQDPDSPYEVAIIAEPLPEGLTQKQNESRIRSKQTRISGVYVNRTFYADIGRSPERLRSMVSFPIDSFKIMTKKQEGIDGFNFEQLFPEHLITYSNLFGITIPYANPENERKD